MEQQPIQMMTQATVPYESPIGRLAASYGISMFFRRWAATVIDFLLLCGFFFGVFLVPEYAQLMVVFVGLLFMIVYYVLLEGFTGFTIGKLALGIRAVDGGGGAPGFVKSVIRSSTRLLETNPLFFGGLPAGITVLATRKNQRLGDIGANTYVVRSRDLVRMSNGRRIPLLCFAVLLTALSLFTAIAGITVAAGTDLWADRTHLSKDGQFQVTASFEWRQQKNLHDEADLAIGNMLMNKYFLLLTESKQDFYMDTTLEDYAYFVEDQYAYELQNSPIYWPRSQLLNGYPAYQFAFESFDEDIGITFIVTTVETEQHYHQLVIWTLSENFEAEKVELYKLLESFTEIGRGYLI